MSMFESLNRLTIVNIFREFSCPRVHQNLRNRASRWTWSARILISSNTIAFTTFAWRNNTLSCSMARGIEPLRFEQLSGRLTTRGLLFPSHSDFLSSSRALILKNSKTKTTVSSKGRVSQMNCLLQDRRRPDSGEQYVFQSFFSFGANVRARRLWKIVMFLANVLLEGVSTDFPVKFFKDPQWFSIPSYLSEICCSVNCDLLRGKWIPPMRYTDYR